MSRLMLLVCWSLVASLAAAEDFQALTRPQSGVIVGQVLDEKSEKPVRRFNVTLQSGRVHRGEKWASYIADDANFRAFAVSDGRFTMSNLPVDHVINVIVDAPDFTRHMERAAPILAPEDAKQRPLTIRLQKARVFSGRVIDATTSQGVAEADISVIEPMGDSDDLDVDLWERFDDWLCRRTTSNADGRFEIPGIMGDVVTVGVWKPGWGRTHLEKVSRSDALEVALYPAAAIRGFIESAAGENPAGGGQGVSLKSATGMIYNGAEVRAGNFAFDDLAPGTYFLNSGQQVGADRLVHYPSLRIVTLGAGENKLLMWDAEGAQLNVHVKGTLVSSAMHVELNTQSPVGGSISGVPDKNGVVTLSAPPGPYSLEIETSNRHPAQVVLRRSVELKAGSNELAYTLDAPTLRVVDAATSEPVADACVSTMHLFESGAPQLADWKTWGREGMSLTSTGSFRIGPTGECSFTTASGNMLIAASATGNRIGIVRKDFSGEPGEVWEVLLQQAGEVSVRLVRDEEPVQAERVYLRHQAGHIYSADADCATSPTRGCCPPHMVYGDGSVRISGVPPGEYELVVRSSEFEVPRKHVRVKPGQAVAIEQAVMPQGRIKLTLPPDAANRYPYFWGRYWLEPLDEQSRERYGRFTSGYAEFERQKPESAFIPVAPGRYRIRAAAAGEERACYVWSQDPLLKAESVVQVPERGDVIVFLNAGH